MDLLHSISPIKKKYETSGSRPFLVQVEGLEHYICKYPRHQPDFRLAKEFFAQRFAMIWEIPVPEIGEIQVSPDHLPHDMLGDGLTLTSIEKTIIGFKLIPDVLEIMDDFSEGISTSDLYKYDKELFFRIALFDIWLSNDDRNTNNTNILINQLENKIKPIAIDHEAIFNTGNLDYQIYEQSYEDSMFYTKLYHRLSTNSQKTIDLIDAVCSSLRPSVKNCQKELDNIFKEIPGHWISDADVLKKKLENNIFTDNWLSLVERTFKEFAALAM